MIRNQSPSGSSFVINKNIPKRSFTLVQGGVGGGGGSSFNSMGYQMSSREERKYSDKQMESVELSSTYLLCVDPETQMPFRMNMGTQQAQSLADRDEININSKIKRQLYQLEELVKIDEYEKEFKWQIKDNPYVDAYHRNFIPFYLLEHEASNFPRYVDFSDLSKNLCAEHTTNIKLYLSPEIRKDIQALILASNKNRLLRSQEVRKGGMGGDAVSLEELQQFQNINSVSLLLTASKLIKIATKKMSELIPFELRNNDDFKDKIRILKFKNYESYLYGDDELIYYQEIRDLLRQNKEIELVLQIVNENDQNTHFPPLFNLKYEKLQREQQIISKYNSRDGNSDFESSQKKASFGRQTFMRRDTSKMRKLSAQKEELEEILSLTEYDIIKEKYDKSSVLFWYPPTQITENPVRVGQPRQPFCDYDYMKTSKSSTMNNQSDDIGMLYHYKRRRKEQLTFNRNKQSQHLPSGKVNEPFSMKVVSLSNLSLKLEDYIDVKDQAQEIEKIQYYDNNWDNLDVQSKLSQIKHDEVSLFLKKCQNQSNKARKDEAEERKRMASRRDSRVINHSSNYYAIQRLSQTNYVLRREDGKVSKEPFKFMPKLIQLQAAIYLGSQRISQYSYSEPVLFNVNVIANETLKFYKTEHVIDDSLLYSLKTMKHKYQELNKQHLLNQQNKQVLLVKDLPSNARIGINIIVIPEISESSVKLPWREGYIFGSVGFPIFDEDRFMCQSSKKLSFWPFEKFNPRIVCKGECFLYQTEFDLKYPYLSKMYACIQLPTFHKPVHWSLQEYDNSNNFQEQQQQQQQQQEMDEEPLMTNREDNELNSETKKLQDVKKMIDDYPLETRQIGYNAKLLFQYRNYIDILPAFVKAVNFTNHEEISICYDYLANSEQARNMEPQEALALLDSQFGDERVRLFAVQKLSHLNDSFISLYMPQLVQALKYELHHRSPLSEFLLERALKNTRVIGHAFFWSLKANLSSIASHERLYLILERFLFCCGKFKNQLYQQNEINRSLIHVWQRVNDFKRSMGKNVDKTRVEKELHKYLKEKEIEMKVKFNLVITHSQYDDQELAPADVDTYYQEKDIYQQKQNNQQLLVKQTYQFNILEIEDIINKIKPQLMEQYENAGEVVYIKNRDKSFIQKLISYNDPLRRIQYTHQGKRMDYWKELFFFPFEPKKPFKFFHDKSGYFTSKQMPLKLVVDMEDYATTYTDDQVENESQYQETYLCSNRAQEQQPREQMQIMFKYGDDLRQDGLVLQFFKLMDKLWLQNDLDLEMIAYNVMETGYRVGYIELVKNSIEVAAIHKKTGHFTGPLDKTSIYNYFKGQILGKDIQQEQVKKFHDAFIKSLAGQCVATYTLGIKDRHTGNFMLQKHTGKFFHIDFGHILGHAKKKFGILRDREPFIYSPELDYFLTHLHELCPSEEHYNRVGSFQKEQKLKEKENKKKKQFSLFACFSPKNKKYYQQPVYNSEEIGVQRFEQFEELCCRAFKIIRENDHIFINLLMLMLVGGIKQLNEDTIKYLIDALLLNKSDEEASSDFKKLIQEALDTTFRKYDNVFHNVNDLIKDSKKGSDTKNIKQADEPQIPMPSQ